MKGSKWLVASYTIYEIGDAFHIANRGWVIIGRFIPNDVPIGSEVEVDGAMYRVAGVESHAICKSPEWYEYHQLIGLLLKPIDTSDI